ncbi:hypothetical protein DSECCO2_07510 [anaerobic digester metagenome]
MIELHSDQFVKMTYEIDVRIPESNQSIDIMVVIHGKMGKLVVFFRYFLGKKPCVPVFSSNAKIDYYTAK